MIDRCYIGDVRDGLRAFIAAGVRAQTCVTSPPYWGLRDYGTAQWEGGDDACDHVERLPSRDASTLTSAGIGQTDEGAAYQAQRRQFRETCGKCGARRIDAQIGLEPTLTEYVATMVDVFRLVRDVLADDGTLWLNLGDSYNAYNGGAGPSSALSVRQSSERPALESGYGLRDKALKPKDLCGIPWRVAFALQADGWYLRSDIIWAKPNPMPESVTDRPTKAHEYLFLLAKSDRYYYDAAAIAEPSVDPVGSAKRYEYEFSGRPEGAIVCPGDDDGQRYAPKGERTFKETRNRRTVWTIATEPYADAHFATFPTALVEPCIAAGSRVGDVVLDPFMGSGTVAQVAQSLGRRWIGCELNQAYVAMQAKRAAQMGLALEG